MNVDENCFLNWSRFRQMVITFGLSGLGFYAATIDKLSIELLVLLIMMALAYTNKQAFADLSRALAETAKGRFGAK